MALISSAVPNLVGGVSQQPPALRLSSACEAMENAWPSVVSGLMKRQPTSLVRFLPFSVSSGALGHVIDRDASYRYIVVLSGGTLRVLSLDGVEQSVSFPDGVSYLTSANPEVDTFRLITVGDTTFVLNRTVSVQPNDFGESGSTRLNPSDMATVYVTNAVPNAFYAIYINGVLKASFKTNDNTSSTSALEATTVIASGLANGATVAGKVSSLVANGIPAGNITVVGSTISIKGLAATDKVQAWTTNGDKSLKSYRLSVTSFSELPPNEVTGRVVQIKGDPTELRDDYYVQFNDNREWVECAGYNQGATVQPATMPHALVRNSDGTWTFKRWTWASRICGDSDSNPHPSFVSNKINDIFIFNNRMGFLSDENVVMSEADTYENFYRTSLAQLLDADPIDYAVVSNSVVILQHAVAFGPDLMLFADKAQFKLSFNNYLSAKTTQVKFATNFNCSNRIRPIAMNGSIYFSDDVSTSKYTKLWEYFNRDDLVSSDNVEEATAASPEYIPSGIRFLAGTTRVNSLVVGSTSDPSTLYLYKYFWNGDKKIQNAVGKWTFPGTTQVYWAAFVNNYLYMLTQREGGVVLEKMNFDEDVFTDPGVFQPLADLNVSFSPGALQESFPQWYGSGTGAIVSYSSATGLSTVKLPFDTSQPVDILVSDGSLTDNKDDMVRLPSTRIGAGLWSVPGDISSKSITAGLQYKLSYTFSKFYLRETGATGKTPILDGRVQMRYLLIEFHNTAYFRAKTILPDRPEYVSDFSGLSNGSVKVGQTPFSQGTFRVPLMCLNTDVKVVLENDTPYPSTFGSAEWQVQYTPKSVRRM